MLALMQRIGVAHGYLENQVFRAADRDRPDAALGARARRAPADPILLRASEEHSGPHAPWFWRGELQGGGVLNEHDVPLGIAGAALC